jgi:hypothetical protein
MAPNLSPTLSLPINKTETKEQQVRTQTKAMFRLSFFIWNTVGRPCVRACGRATEPSWKRWRQLIAPHAGCSWWPVASCMIDCVAACLVGCMATFLPPSFPAPSFYHEPNSNILAPSSSSILPSSSSLLALDQKLAHAKMAWQQTGCTLKAYLSWSHLTRHKNIMAAFYKVWWILREFDTIRHPPLKVVRIGICYVIVTSWV